MLKSIFNEIQKQTCEPSIMRANVPHFTCTGLSSGKTGGIVFLVLALLIFSPDRASSQGANSEAANSMQVADANFQRFINEFWPRARKSGIRADIYKQAFAGLTPDPKVLKLNATQPEFVKPIWNYINTRLNEQRISRGQEMLQSRTGILDAIEAVYGVDRHILVAIWGLESNYGSFTGRHNVIRALATLSYQGRRQRYGRSQLIAALKILQKGDVTPDKMFGSWAGAMGHTQFIPTTYELYAVDFDGDKKRDVWTTEADALGSAANYLRRSKWEPGKTWGYEVRLPAGFDYSEVGRSRAKSIRDWTRLGVRRVRGKGFPRPRDVATLIVPSGANGPAFLVLKNFRAILRYNNAVAYALAVGHLADRLRGLPEFATPWPLEDVPIANKAGRKELQIRLKALGYKIGTIDGKIGNRTRAALRRYQRAKGLPADGYPSARVLEFMRNEG